MKSIHVAGKPLRQASRRLLGKLRRRAFDNDHDQIDASRKRGIEDELALAPR